MSQKAGEMGVRLSIKVEIEKTSPDKNPESHNPGNSK